MTVQLTPGIIILLMVAGAILGGISNEIWNWIYRGRKPETADDSGSQLGSGAAEMTTVYLCHKFADNPKQNAARVLEIVKTIKKVRPRVAVLAPQIYLPQFFSEAEERERAMRTCLALLRPCDSMWVENTDPTISSGMRQELDACRAMKKPVYFFRERDGRITDFKKHNWETT